MSAFGGSARYYDLFYGDKDTAAECAFVRGVIERHAPSVQSVLDLGCGSARHAAEFAKAGLSVTGIDRSDGMIAQARTRVRHLSSEVRDRIVLSTGDVTTYQATRTYDAVVSLFHVIDYQTTDEALAGIFHTARRAPGEGGVFLFDFWYGPAVQAQQPERREKHFENGEVSLKRLAEPALHADRHIVDVHYTLTVRDRKTGAVENIRYLFLPEIERFAVEAGLTIVEHGAWLSGQPLSERTWSGYAVARVQ